MNLISLFRRAKTSSGEFLSTDLYFSLSQKDGAQVLRALKTSMDGLTPARAQYEIELLGRNEIAHEKAPDWPFRLLKTVLNPFILLLIGLAILSVVTGDVPGAVIVSLMVMISVLLTFYQESRSNRAAESLRSMVSTTVTVMRKVRDVVVTSLDGPVASAADKFEILLADLVPGDILLLSAGDMIPADLRVIHSKDLFISQAALTGEALPVEKQALAPKTDTRSLLDLKNICFMGTNVVSGTATAVVMKTGSNTYFGSIAKDLIGQRVLTGFDKGLNRFTWLMLRFMMVMVPLVFIVNGLSKGNWLEAFMFAVAVAVGLTPEMLPMIVTVNLAKGALAMSRKKVIVKRLNSIQNFGAMDTLCTDKTGTLTQDRVILEKYVDLNGEKSEPVLKYAYLNSFHQTGLKSLLDNTVLKHVEVHGSLEVEKKFKKIDEIPFDFVRRRMSVVVAEQGQKHILICKGALEEILKISSHAQVDGQIVPMDSEHGVVAQRVAREMNEDGLRVIAVAYKDTSPTQVDYSVKDEDSLVLLGFVAFLDPPKETAAEAIRALNQYGVTVKVLTGDSDIVARNICRQVGIPAEQILRGFEMESMTDTELGERVEVTHLFAKLNPKQKERIIRVMHMKGHVVGFLGDGINDAPALRAADVGISVDNAVDIAKESADIILLEKSLLVLEEGVIEGRRVFGNIIKYIKMGASSNFGNVFSVVGASMLLPFLPMMPVQLLFQNLLYDLSQTAIPLDRVDPEYLLTPRKWAIEDIGRFMLFMGPVSSIFDYLTFALMWFVFHASTPANQSLFQTGWFVEGLLSQTLIVHIIRTAKIPFLQSTAAWPLIFTTVLIMAVGIVIPFSPFAPALGLVALPSAFFPWLMAMLLVYVALGQIVKHAFVKRYGFN